MTLKEKEKTEYLERYEGLNHLINTLKDELEKINLDAIPGGMDYSKDRVQTSPSSDQMVNYVIRKEKIENDLQTAYKKQDEIRTAINLIENYKYRTILHRRYILLQTWEEVANAMIYSTQRIYEMRKEALNEFKIPISREKQS